MKSKPLLFIKVGSIVVAVLFLTQFIPDNLFEFWDFRNNLWGPSYLLITGRSPYIIKQIFPDTNAVWMPIILGLFFPLGLFSFSIASKLWFLSTIISIGIIVYLSMIPFRITPIKFTLTLLLVFFFPPLLLHIEFGQISSFVTLSFILVAFFWNSSFWKALFCVLALTKPQLCVLVLPGILLRTYRSQGRGGLLRLCCFMFIWVLLLLTPLFVLFPNWIPGFIGAILDNANWAQPSLLFYLTTQLGSKVGFLVWLVSAIISFIGNLFLWNNVPIKEATFWSLAFTGIVSPYIWSWDFVLLLPCFLHLLAGSSNWATFAEIVVGFLVGSFMIWKIRWNAQVSDEVFFWVPIYFFSIYVLNLLITKVLFSYSKNQPEFMVEGKHS